MSITKRLFFLILAATTVLVASRADSWARGTRDGLGLRAGFSRGPDQFLIGGQGGFGDVVLHPDFAENRLVYLSYAEQYLEPVQIDEVDLGQLLRTAGS